MTEQQPEPAEQTDIAERSLLSLEANLSSQNALSLRDTLLARFPAPGIPLALDAQAVDQLSTATLQVLLAAAAQLQAQGSRLVLENPSSPLQEWSRLAGVSWLSN